MHYLHFQIKNKICYSKDNCFISKITINYNSTITIFAEIYIIFLFNISYVIFIHNAKTVNRLLKKNIIKQ